AICLHSSIIGFRTRQAELKKALVRRSIPIPTRIRPTRIWLRHGVWHRFRAGPSLRTRCPTLRAVYAPAEGRALHFSRGSLLCRCPANFQFVLYESSCQTPSAWLQSIYIPFSAQQEIPPFFDIGAQKSVEDHGRIAIG